MSVQIKGVGTIGGIDEGLVVSGILTATSGVHIDDSIVHIGDTNTKIRFPATDTISFETGGSEVLSMNLDGLVTGGQTNPTSSDNGNIYIKNASTIGGVGHAVNYVSNAVFNGAWKYINSGTGATRIVVNQNGFEFDTAGSGTAGNNITFSNKFNIASGGAIGFSGSYGSSGQVLTSQGNSSAPTWTTVSSVTIANNANNRVITGGSGNNLNAETTVEIDANGKMSLGATSADRILDIHQSTTNAYSATGFSAADNTLLRIHNPSGTDNSGVGYHTGLEFVVSSGANSYGQLGYVRTGNNIGDFFFKHRTAASSYRETLRVKSDNTTILGGYQGTGNANSSIVNENVIINCSSASGYDNRHTVSFGQLDSNWTGSGGASQWGMMWHYASSVSNPRQCRAGIVFDHAGTEEFKIWSSYGDIVFNGHSSNAGDLTAEQCNTELARFDNNGHFVPGANNARDLGTSSKKWRNIYVMDMHFSNEGGSPNSVDGTTGDWTLQEGEDGIYMINNKNGKKYEMMLKEVQ